MTQLSDRNLNTAYCRGETSAFEAIVRRHGGAVLGYLTKMTHNKDHAEDLFQETFQKVHQHAVSFKGEDLRPWLLKIAANSAIGYRRKEHKHAAVSLAAPVGCPDGGHCATLESALPSAEPGPVEALTLEEKRQAVRRALEHLPDQQRAALILNYYHHLTYKQIAESLGCSVGAVRSHLFRALKRMAATLPNPTGDVQ